MKYNLSLLFANALFALNYSFFVSVMQAESLSIGAIYLLQSLVLVIILAIWSLLFKERVSAAISLRDHLIISLTAVCSSLGWSYATLEGMSLSSPIDAATIASAGPSLTLIFAHILGLRRVTRHRLWGIGISLFGVLVLLLSPQWSASQRGSGAEMGNCLLVVAVVVSAVNTLILKPQLERYGLRRVALIYAVAASVVSVPIFAHQLSEVNLARVDILEVVALLIIGSVTPLMLLFEGCEHLSALHTSLYRYVQPFVTSLVVITRGQAQIVGANYVALAAIIVGGVLVAQGVDRGE